MEKKETKSKTEGKYIMRLIVSAIHLILIRVNILETCAHIWGLTNSRAHSGGWKTWKDNYGLFVCLFCSVFDDTLISNTEYISWNDRTEVHNKMGRMWMQDVAH
jgi:hypothetical protein